MGRKTRNTTALGVIALLLLGGCEGLMVPERAPDFVGPVLTVVFALPGSEPTDRLPEFFVQEEDQDCPLSFESGSAEVFLRRADGSLKKGSGLDIHPGRVVKVSTRDGIVDSCPRRAIAEVVEVQLP